MHRAACKVGSNYALPGFERALHPYRTDDQCYRAGNGLPLQALVYFFVEALALDVFVGEGVAEQNLISHARGPMPRDLWSRDVLLDFRTDDVSELMFGDQNPIRRLWSQIKVRQPKEANHHKSKGLQGRPTHFELVEEEFQRRVAEGNIESSLDEQANVLAEWLRHAHPEIEKPLSADRIKKNVRDTYWKAVGNVMIPIKEEHERRKENGTSASTYKEEGEALVAWMKRNYPGERCPTPKLIAGYLLRNRRRDRA